MDISIIIPIYNAELYLRECLDSVLAQTIVKKEIICIDDGSEDDSYRILQEYVEKYNEIYILHQENKGAGEARNAGLAVAKGEYVCFLDADDYYLDETALEKMVRACKEHNVKVCGSFRKIKYVENERVEKYELHRELCDGNPQGVMLNFFDYQEDYHYQNYIFALDIIKRNKIVFPFYRRYQDPPFFLKVMVAAKIAWILPVELYCLRLGHQNFKQHGKLIEDILMGIEENMQLAKKYGLNKLQNKLILRINNDFYWYITENFNNKVLEILINIEKNIINKNYKIKHLLEVCDHYKMVKMNQEVNDCYYIMRMLVETQYRGIKISEYLLMSHVYNIAIYGLGRFGTALYNELKNSEINIVYAIDQNKKCMEELLVVSDLDNLKRCDMIIVTPLKDGMDIIQELKKKTMIPAYTLIEILNKIENYM